ncbi:DUF935 domain-containing protein [Methylosinus sp. Sm6]|uniref:DUF935 domain-containing protein n=1 Tax=Methylosinus sp. Sm6 TaxID=2866948 RepID=UPI001C994CA2|nr:DUF935 domain-containing protein [Methylosinus sp. Sm6]MBY6243862.1 DUF935 domain-containing protein [Methylosinus sp. Sm6]
MVETRRSSILGPDGEPVQVPLLEGQTAAPERYGPRALIYYSEASGLTPGKLGEIMRSANMGLAKAYLTLAVDMEERYWHYGSQLNTRRLALDGVTTSVSAPKGVNAKAVDFVETLINDPEYIDVAAMLQDGVGKGYSVVEPVWEYQQGALRPVRYQHRDARYFRYDEVALSDLCLLADSGQPGPKVAPPYFLKHEPLLRTGLPIRRGLARPAAWAFVFQTFTLQDWAAFCEIYGIPFRIGKYHPAATDADKATLLRAVRSIANDAAAIIPAGMEIDFQETNGNRGEAVFGNFIDYLDAKISLMILGQTMTAEVSKSGGSLAQAKVQENVRMDIVRFDARQHMKTINRDLIRYAVAMNFGPQEVYPSVEMELAENEDLVALGDFLEKAVGKGLKVGQKFVRRKASIPEPEADEELLGAPAAPEPAPVDPKRAPHRAQLGAGCGCPMCGAAPRSFARLAADDPTAVTAIDETDELVDEALSDYQEIVDPLLAGLLAAVGEATTFEEALANLETAKIDTGPLLDRLARATAISRGLGDLKD